MGSTASKTEKFLPVKQTTGDWLTDSINVHWGSGDESHDEAGSSSQQSWEHDGTEPSDVKTVVSAGNPIGELVPDSACVLLGEAIGRQGTHTQLSAELADIRGAFLDGGDTLGGKLESGGGSEALLASKSGRLGSGESLASGGQQSDDDGGRELHYVVDVSVFLVFPISNCERKKWMAFFISRIQIQIQIQIRIFCLPRS